jgi:nitrogenase-stabilizing/protective protein
MSELEQFHRLNNLTDYLHFFEIPCEESLVHAKRFHILRLFGEQVAKVADRGINDEARLMAIYRFALLSIIKRYEAGYAPSAAEIWGMMDKPGGCLACATQVGCNTDQNGCATTPTIDFAPQDGTHLSGHSGPGEGR